MALDDVVVLNVDTNTLETPYEDLQSLPNDVVSNIDTAHYIFRKAVNFLNIQSRFSHSCVVIIVFV